MFQQDIIDTLNEFEVKSKDDYYRMTPNMRPHFVRHFYKAFKQNQDEAYKDLSVSGGVKLHFDTSGDLTCERPNVPSETFLKKLCFYANRTLVTFPFKEINRADQTRLLKTMPAKAWRKSDKDRSRPLLFGDVITKRTPVGAMVGLGPAGGYSIDPAAFDDFLTVITQLRPAVESGLTYLLPAFPDAKREQRRRLSGLVKANFKLDDLWEQFNEDSLQEDYVFQGDLLRIYLPHFTEIPLNALLDIREKNLDAYNDFQRYLENVFQGVGEDESELRLLNLLKDIDQGVREIEKKFKAVQSEYARKSTYIGIGVVSTGLAMLAGSYFSKDFGQMIAAMTGGATSLQFVTQRGELSSAKDRLASERFYVPWLLHKNRRADVPPSI